MKRVAIYGNAGGGKSTLARPLAMITGLPLHPLDKLRYSAGGGEVPDEAYRRRHAELVAGDAWIIDGFGCIESVWERFSAADTLVHVDLPLSTHFLWVTKRLVKGIFVTPQGWPDKSPTIRGSLNSFRVLWPCHRRLTPRYRAYSAEVAGEKRVHHLQSSSDMRAFLTAVQREVANSTG